MKYRICNGAWHEYPGTNVQPLQKAGEVIVAIDPAKGNMAVVIGDPYGAIYSYLEISGTNCDTTEYCNDFSKFIVQYLSNVKIKCAGVEAAVSYQGMKYHISQMVLTEVRANILQMFYNNYGFRPIEINNWTWKTAILPDGYRSQKEKGSLRYLTEKGLTGLTHDVTDAMCMYMYLIKQLPKSPDLYCTQGEKSLCKYTAILVNSADTPKGWWEHKVNPEFSLEENIGYYLNRTVTSGHLSCKASDISLEEIYNGNFSKGLTRPAEDLKVVVIRTT